MIDGEKKLFVISGFISFQPKIAKTNPVFSFTDLGLNTVSKESRFCSRGSCRKHLVHLSGGGKSSVQASLLLAWPSKESCVGSLIFSKKIFPPKMRVIRLVGILRITYLIKRGVYFVIENPSTSLLWRYKCVKVSQLMKTVARQTAQPPDYAMIFVHIFSKISGIYDWPWKQLTCVHLTLIQEKILHHLGRPKKFLKLQFKHNVSGTQSGAWFFPSTQLEFVGPPWNFI